MDEKYGSILVQDYNRTAVNAARRISLADTSGIVFYHGPSGMQKTLLSRMIEKSLLEAKPDAIVTLANAYTMSIEFEYAVRKNTIALMEENYKYADLIVLEDFEVVNSGISFANAIADILEWYVQYDKKIVLTSSFTPDPDNLLSEKLNELICMDSCEIIEMKTPSTKEKLEMLMSVARDSGIKTSAQHKELMELISNSYMTVSDVINAYKRSIILLSGLAGDDNNNLNTIIQLIKESSENSEG